MTLRRKRSAINKVTRLLRKEFYEKPLTPTNLSSISVKALRLPLVGLLVIDSLSVLPEEQ